MNIMKPDFELIALPPHSRQKALTCASFSYEQGNFTHAKRKSTTESLCPYGAYAWLLKIFRGFITFNSHYTNNMPVFFATNLHFPAAIAVALVSLYFVAFPSLELAIPCIT